MTEIKPVTKKVLESGIVDRSMVELLEKWGNLPQGSADMVKDDALQGVTKDHLVKLANDLATEVEKEHVLRETNLDLDRIRWPTVVDIQHHAEGVAAVVDRMGRYYFRIGDIDQSWFAPGGIIARAKNKSSLKEIETIVESQVLYIGENPVCLQVSTMKK